MAEQKNILIIFPEKANSVLEDIMEKYNLKENIEEIFKNLKEDRPARIVIVNHLTKDFVKGKISEKELIASLKKDLAVSQQTAEKISKDIIGNLIPLLKKIPEEELREKSVISEIEEKLTLIKPIKPPISLEKIKEEEITEPEIKKPSIPQKPEKIKEVKKPVKKEIKEPDVYRESIE